VRSRAEARAFLDIKLSALKIFGAASFMKSLNKLHLTLFDRAIIAFA